MFSTDDGRGYGLTVFDLQDIRGLWHLSWRPKLLVMLNTPKNARRLEGDLCEKGNRPVEVCTRRGGLYIWPIKDALSNY